MILNTTTGKIYSTIAEAARAAGVSASGISRVASGQRQSAGGYGWEKIETPAAAPSLVKAAKAAERRQKRESPKKYERTKAARAKSRAKATQNRQRAAAAAKQKAAAAAQPKPKRPSVSPELRIARADTLEKIMQINELRRQLQTEYENTPLPSTQNAINSLDEFIKNLTNGNPAAGGYIPEDRRFVAGFGPLPEVERIGNAITETMAQITVVSDSELAKLYNQYRRNVSKDMLEQNYKYYAGFLEAIGMARDLAGRTNGKGKYSEIYSNVMDTVIDAQPEAILKVTQEILKRVKEEQKITKSWVNQVLKEWKKEKGFEQNEPTEFPIIHPNW